MRRRMIALAAFALVVALLALVTLAHAEEPVRLAEPDLLRLRLLLTERQLIAERFATVKAVADFDYANQTAQIEAFVRDLAEREGFDLSDYEPDARLGIWRRKPAK